MMTRSPQSLMPIVLVMIVMSLAASGFFELYWLRDNQWLIDSTKVNIAPGQISANLASNSSRVWLNVAVPVFAICLVGLAFSFPKRKPDASKSSADARLLQEV